MLFAHQFRAPTVVWSIDGIDGIDGMGISLSVENTWFARSCFVVHSCSQFLQVESSKTRCTNLKQTYQF